MNIKELKERSKKQIELKSILAECYGSENIFRHWTGMKYTDGICVLAEVAKCHWLLDIVASYQHLSYVKKEEFQSWTIEVKDNKAVVFMTNGNSLKRIIEQYVDYTDFPLDELQMYFIDNTLMLTTEY